MRQNNKAMLLHTLLFTYKIQQNVKLNSHNDNRNVVPFRMQDLDNRLVPSKHGKVKLVLR
jgi:hypothetical protein